MALSFGRKKDSDADAATTNPTNSTPSANPAPTASASTAGGDELLDESWFETAFAEEAASPTPPLAVNAAPTPPQSAAAPIIEPPVDPDFTVFDPEPAPATSQDDFGGFGVDLNAPSPNTSANTGAFADPALATPFDTTPVGEAAPPQKGGAKKLLPILALLVIVGGGGAFWFTQMNGSSTEEETPPAVTTPATSPPAAAPTTATPGGTKPAATSKAPAASATKKAPAASATKEPPFQARIGRLWAEGAWRFKKGDKAGARAKWEAAIKLAKSKPGYEKSAAAIQEAIDKKLK